MLKYRPDVDGLRTVAVLPVLFFHAGIPGFAGGFVGVDVFFVISGFLITSILVRDIDGGRFSILRFYERRFRRLLPALFAMMSAVTLIAGLLLSPGRMRLHGSQVTAASLFSSNLYFTMKADYFAPAAEEQLLLHTWSLAVEEQFYLFFPLILLFLGKRPRLRIGVVASIAVVSFAASAYLTPTHPTSSFFLLHTRAWELMIGSLLAVGILRPPRSRAERDGTASVGLAAILLAVGFYDGATPFPGYAAALPVLGTALVLHAGRDGSSLGGRLLSLPLMVFIGKLSYSLYLWHWPVLLLTRSAMGGGRLPVPVALVSLLLSGVLAWLSLRFVEDPLRHARATRRQILVIATLASSSFALLGLGVRRVGPSLWNENSAQLTEAEGAPRACIGSKGDYRPPCRFGGEPVGTVVFGDSHAHALLPVWEALATETGGLEVWAHTACPPLLGTTRTDDVHCLRHNERVLAMLDEARDVDHVLLAGRWALSVEAHKPEDPLHDVVVEDREGRSGEAAVRAGLERTVDRLIAAGKQVVLMRGTPEFPLDVPEALGLRHHLGMEPVTLPLVEVKRRNLRADAILDEVAARHDAVRVVSFRDLLCDDERCETLVGGRSLYRDGHHLSLHGAEVLVERGAVDRLRAATNH